jgi:hypothetical protein
MDLHYWYMILTTYLAYQYANKKDKLESHYHKVYMGLTTIYSGLLIKDYMTQ